MKYNSLEDAELEIMQIVWHANAKVNSKYILSKLGLHRQWQLSTLMTALNRLIKKNYLQMEKDGANNLYWALIMENEYKQENAKHILERIYGNSLENFVMSLIDNKIIGDEDVKKLAKIFDEHNTNIDLR